MAPDNPICLGLPKVIHLLDEAYWPLKGDRSKVTILATSDETVSNHAPIVAPQREQTRLGPISAVQGQLVRGDQAKPEPMFYGYQAGKGRVFSCILGHYTWTFDDPYFRILLLRGMAWAAGESPYRFDQLVMRGARLAGKGR